MLLYVIYRYLTKCGHYLKLIKHLISDLVTLDNNKVYKLPVPSHYLCQWCSTQSIRLVDTFLYNYSFYLYMLLKEVGTNSKEEGVIWRRSDLVPT